MRAQQGSQEEKEAWAAADNPLSVLNALLAIALAWWSWTLTPPDGRLTVALLVFWIAGAYVTPLLIVCAMFFLPAVGAALDFLLIEPLAWAFDRSDIEVWVKVFALVSLLIGFHFDLLAS